MIVTVALFIGIAIGVAIGAVTAAYVFGAWGSASHTERTTEKGGRE